jgi:glycosyltransferase involved in cell wall biosynthesis
MKILHVVENLNRGGLERVVIDLARLQAQHGHDIHVICIMDKGLLAPELENVNIEVVPLNKQNIGGLSALTKLRQKLKEIVPDVIHTHNPLANYFVALASIGISRINMVNTRHGMGQYWKSRKGKALFLFSQLRTRYVVAVCDLAREKFIESGQVIAAKAITLKNGINIDKTTRHNLVDKAGLCQMLNLPISSKLFGTVGR